MATGNGVNQRRRVGNEEKIGLRAAHFSKMPRVLLHKQLFGGEINTIN